MITDLLGLERPGILLLSHNSSEHMCVLPGQESEENPTALALEICLRFCSLGWASWVALLVLSLVKLTDLLGAGLSWDAGMTSVFLHKCQGDGLSMWSLHPGTQASYDHMALMWSYESYGSGLPKA